MDLLSISKILLAGLFITAGIAHFRMPRFFLYIMPPWVPGPDAVNKIVGVLEIALGIALLFEPFRMFAAWGLVLLLIAVFPANIYHYQLSKKKGKHVLPTLLRLPLQPLLIYWAYTLTL